MAQPKATKTAGEAAPKAVKKKGALKEAMVDTALKKRWEGAFGRYRSALANESVGWDTRYEALDEIINAEPPYYLAGGYVAHVRQVRGPQRRSGRRVPVSAGSTRPHGPDDG